MSNSGRARRWGTLAVETCASLLLVLVIFSLFMLFLNAMFPSGTPLKELMEGTLEPGPGRYAGGKQAEATLALLQRDVRYRRGNSIAWGSASEGMPLFSQDAVQTLDYSGARLSFGRTDHLQMGSNSLVVVTRLDADDDDGERSYRVQVDGELRGNLSAARKLQMEVAAAGHLAKISAGRARFRITPNGAGSQSLAIYAGEAQVVGRGGMIRVPARYGVTLTRGLPVGPAVPLPGAPALSGEKARYSYRLLPPKVRFNWNGPPGEYHFQLSQDRTFRKCLVDQKLSSGGADPAASPHHYATGILSKGSYYWRVSRISQGMEGGFSSIGECELVQLLRSPELAVDFPPERAPAGAYTLTGIAAPGSTIFVDGVEVARECPGKFECQVRLKPGVNLIRVEAVDVAGNASYASRIVYGRSEPKRGGEKEIPEAR